jgi:hypothetical protein
MSIAINIIATTPTPRPVTREEMLARLRPPVPRGQTRITVFDSIMGAGKSTFILKKLREWHGEDNAKFWDEGEQPRKFLVVVPLLSEVDRFTSALPELDFKDPQPVEGRKLHHLKTLIENDENVVTTHSLFSMLTRDIYAMLKERNYVLIIDEVLDAVSMFNELSVKDRDILFAQKMVSVDPRTKRLVWNQEDHGSYTGRFDTIRALCETGSLVLVRDSMLLWEFPSEFLRCFREVYVATYMLFGSPFFSYLRAEGFEIEMRSITSGRSYPWIEGGSEAHIKKKIRELVTVYEGKANDTYKEGQKEHPLSSSWVKRQSEETLKKLKGQTEKFFERFAKTPPTQNGWTTWSAQRTKLRGKRYSRNSNVPGKSFGFIASNARATNDFREVASMAYLCNVFYHPVVKGYFEDQGVDVYEDLYALCQMLQWIWRSRIRCGQPITLFIPSERMRTLFKRWLAADETLDLINELHPENGLFGGYQSTMRPA